MDWHRWSTNFLIRRLQILVLTQEQEYLRIKNRIMNRINLSLKNFRGASKMHSSYRDNIWSTDLVDVQLISKYNKVSDSCCVLLIFTANAPDLFRLKERCVAITNAFQKKFDESGSKPNKISVHQGSEFHNRSISHGCMTKALNCTRWKICCC